jgi:hypothetical protein
MSIDQLEQIKRQLDTLKANTCVQEFCAPHTVLIDFQCIQEQCFINAINVTSVLYSNEPEKRSKIWIVFLVLFLIIFLYIIQKTWRNHKKNYISIIQNS